MLKNKNVDHAYGQPKIHKTRVPICPIVSYSGSPLYNLNKYIIANILKTYVKHGFLITFLDLVNLVLTTTWYTFTSQFYQQTDGVAMGGPASSTTSEIYTEIHTDQYQHYSSHHQTCCKESVVSYLFNRAYSIITNKDDLHKENARIKQVLKENGYQESIISKIFKRITKNRSLPQLQQQMQATDIQEKEVKMSINLPYFEGTSEKLRRIRSHILRSHKIRSTFYTENTLCKFLCKLKD